MIIQFKSIISVRPEEVSLDTVSWGANSITFFVFLTNNQLSSNLHLHFFRYLIIDQILLYLFWVCTQSLSWVFSKGDADYIVSSSRRQPVRRSFSEDVGYGGHSRANG